MPPDLHHVMEHTDACSIPRSQLAKTVVGMAHFAGTGPNGSTCSKCTFFQRPEGRQKNICMKFAQLTGDSKKPIPGDSPSCRYFEARAAAREKSA